jgi:general secretion pathway protein K
MEPRQQLAPGPPVAVALRATPRSGSVLILALWVLFFLAALAIAVGAHVSAGLRMAGTLKQDSRVYQAARAGVAHATLRVASNTNAWDGLGPAAWNGEEERFLAVEVQPGVAFSVINVLPGPEGGAVTNSGPVGVNARLCINDFDERIFDALLYRVAGIDDGGALALRDAMTAYREAKAERLLTMQSGSAYAQSPEQTRARFESLHELLQVEGVDAGLFQRVAPYVTVFGGRRLNVNAAPVDLLQACVDAYPAAAEAIERAVAARAAGEVLTGAGDVGPVAFLTVRSEAFEGVSIGYAATGAQEARIAFVVDTEGRRLLWREQ